MKYVHESAQKAKDSFWISANLQPKWSGILCFDGTYITVKNLFAKLARRQKWYDEGRKLMIELSEKFLRDFEQLTMYLQYEKGLVPTTSNVVENLNKQLKHRLKPMCGFETINSAENYLKLWCLKRRF